MFRVDYWGSRRYFDSSRLQRAFDVYKQCLDKADKKMDIIIPYGVAKSYVHSYHIHFLMKMYDSSLEKREC